MIVRYCYFSAVNLYKILDTLCLPITQIGLLGHNQLVEEEAVVDRCLFTDT